MITNYKIIRALKDRIQMYMTRKSLF